LLFKHTLIILSIGSDRLYPSSRISKAIALKQASNPPILSVDAFDDAASGLFH